MRLRRPNWKRIKDIAVNLVAVLVVIFGIASFAYAAYTSHQNGELIQRSIVVSNRHHNEVSVQNQTIISQGKIIIAQNKKITDEANVIAYEGGVIVYQSGENKTLITELTQQQQDAHSSTAASLSVIDNLLSEVPLIGAKLNAGQQALITCIKSQGENCPGSQ